MRPERAVAATGIVVGLVGLAFVLGGKLSGIASLVTLGVALMAAPLVLGLAVLAGVASFLCYDRWRLGTIGKNDAESGGREPDPPE